MKSGRAHEPVVFVSFYDGLRFAGGWNDGPTLPSASIALADDPTLEQYDVGLRLATVPEPGQLLLAAAGALALAAARRRRA